MSKNIKAYGINYTLPKAHLLNATPLYISEFAGRTCYNSFDKSEHCTIQNLNEALNLEKVMPNHLVEATNEVNADGSELLYQLSHVYHHASVLEHVTLNFLIKNTSRAVLQELARHRIASYSVQSTRYTMSDIINWFNICITLNLGLEIFIEKILELDIFVTDDLEYNTLEIAGIWNKLVHQMNILGTKQFQTLSIAKSIMNDYNDKMSADELFKLLSSKPKKNVGDFIKMSVVTESTSVDLAFTINLRSLKNFMELRLNGASFHQMQWLAYTIYKQIPKEYLTLIVKDSKAKQFETIEQKILSGEWS